ncbi:hypothetical protein IFM89_007327 [Coptis chinensis]|uniref:Protein kinase domain-containing protein n=1 Tax=Coptis chinensis TaxID=261450 RepID=A0A835LI16_9MAGN|nr:hypothetical protein IFM89_007327 [Coptis chinensis]
MLGGDLFEKVVKKGWCSKSKSALILKELISRIKHCHENGVVHRDIKRENIPLTTSKVEACGFWTSGVVDSNRNHLSGLVGSRSYVAPKFFWEIIREELREAHKKKKLNLNSGMWVTISRPARDLIRRMLTWDVSSRLTADEVPSHPWIQRSTKNYGYNSSKRMLMRQRDNRGQIGVRAIFDRNGQGTTSMAVGTDGLMQQERSRGQFSVERSQSIG